MKRAQCAHMIRRAIWLPVMASVVIGCGASVAAASSNSARATAKAAVSEFEQGAPALSLSALKKRPAKGIKVAVVTCTVPTCQADAQAAPYKALGWKMQMYPYDLGGGPAALDKAFANAIASHPRYIAVLGIFPYATFSSEVKQATAAGIGVVVQANGAQRIPGALGCVACLNQQFKTGVLQADIAIADGATGGQVAYANDPTAGPLTDNYDGAKSQVAKLLNGAQLPLIQLSQGATPAQNTSTVVTYLQRNPNIKYVMFSVESLVSGVPEALAQDGLAARVKIIDQSPQPTDLQEIADGQQLAAVGSTDIAADWGCADLLARASTGTKISAPQSAPTAWHRIIDKSNVAKVQGKPVEPPNFEAVFEKAWHLS